MSGNLGESQPANLQSSAAPRKRPRQDSACDIDSGIGNSEGGSGSGSVSSESGEAGDGRQGGSQKRARSEGHGEQDASHTSGLWPRNGGSRGASNYSSPAHLLATSASSSMSPSSIGSSRYLSSGSSMRESSSEPSFIPLPAVSVTRDAQEDALDSPDSEPSHRSMSNAAQDALNRSMAFDEQMDVLRRSPSSIPASPATGVTSLSAASEDHAVEPREPRSPSEERPPVRPGELDAFGPEPGLGSAVDQPTSSGRLHALADTASVHSRLFPTPPGLVARSGAASLSPVHLPFSTHPTSAAFSNGSSLTMPPSRLRLFRRQEQSRLQPRPTSHPSPPLASSFDSRERQLSASGVIPSPTSSQDTSETVPPFTRGGASTSSSLHDLPLPPIAGPPQPLDSSVYTSPVRQRHTLSRSNFFNDMRDPFEPFEPSALHDRLLPDFNMYGGLDAFSARRPRRQPDSSTAVGGPIETQRPFGYWRHVSDVPQTQTLPDSIEESNPFSTAESRSRGVPQTTANDIGSRDGTPGRPAAVERSPSSFWTGMFDELDSERAGSPRRPASTLERVRADVRRSASDTERDGPSLRHNSDYSVFREDFRRGSPHWDWARRPVSVSDDDHYSATASSSSLSSRTRSISRSLLDPTLRFGTGPSVLNPRSSSDSQANRPRHGPRARLPSWFDEVNGDEEEDLLDLGHPTLRREHIRSEGLSPFSSFFSIGSMERDEDPSSLPSPAFRRTSNSRNSPVHNESPWTRAMPGRGPAMDRDAPFSSRPPVHPTYGIERALDNATETPQSNSHSFWDDDFTELDSLDRRAMPRDVSSALPVARHHPSSPTPRDPSRPLSSFGNRVQPSSDISALRRLRRPVETTQGRSSSIAADSMEDIIPESNARESDSLTAPFRGHQSPPPFPPVSQNVHVIDPPPRPVEPRLSSWDVGPHPSIRIPSRRFRPPSPSEFPSLFPQGQDSPDAVHSTSAAPTRSQRSTDIASQPPLERHRVPTLSDQYLAHRQVSDADGNPDSRSSAGPNSPPRSDLRFPHAPSDRSSSWRQPSPPRRPGASGLRIATETFTELVRRRAARAEAQSRAARRSPSPDSGFRLSYRLPRPNFLLDEDDSPRLERRSSAALSGHTSPTEPSSANEESATSRFERLELERQQAAHLLERSVPSRYSSSVGASRYQDYLASTRADRERMMAFGRQQPSEDGGRDGHQAMTARARMLERFGRRSTAPSNRGSRFMDLFGSSAETTGGSRERQQVHEAIGRHSRDDEDARRRSLPHMDRPRSIVPRDPMSDETARNIQRRLRESEAEVGRALRALDQWGELESSGDLDPAHSRMHRFGETLRRRRAHPAFNFGGTSIDHDSTVGTSSGRRSPSPTSAAARLQTRQARFARAQGRLREPGVDLFGDSRSRGFYGSGLGVLGGSRFASRYATRSLGDYMRDEDFDASYENLVRLAAAVGDAKPRGTPAHLLAAMPTGFYKDFATPGCETRCPICLDDYKELDPVLRISDCDHWFHKECLEQWLQGARSCPVCRRSVRGGGRSQQCPPDDAPGPSGSRRDDGSDDDGPGGGPGGTGGPPRIASPALTLAELGAYAEGW